MARHHDVWVLTNAHNRSAIERELGRRPVLNLHFTYYELPRWSAWWARGKTSYRLYHYIWQGAVYFVARRLDSIHHFDLVHHVTFGKCWTPSFLALLPVPFLWGPIGGAESAPMAFWRDCGPRGFVFEATRESARWLSRHGPFLKLTARRSRLSLAKTKETADWLHGLGAPTIRVCSESGLSQRDLDCLRSADVQEENGFRFISIGNLLHLKGFHLGLRAFAQSGIDDAEYWVVGHGPEQKRLQELARKVGIADRVRFWGKLPRNDTLTKLAACHVLVHPSLHDSGGWVCLEAMGAGRPVICLDIGGPATQVTAETGFKISAHTPQQAVDDMARAMRALASDAHLRARMGCAARERIIRDYMWDTKREVLSATYAEIVCHPRARVHHESTAGA